MKIQTTGHILCTVVPGTSPTGRYAADGTTNIVLAPGTKPVGHTHPCGALYATAQTDKSKGHHAADGSANVFWNGSAYEILLP